MYNVQKSRSHRKSKPSSIFNTLFWFFIQDWYSVVYPGTVWLVGTHVVLIIICHPVLHVISPFLGCEFLVSIIVSSTVICAKQSYIH